MSRRFTALLAAVALAASFGVSAGGNDAAAASKAASPSVQISVGIASSRLSVLRPQGGHGGDQPDAERPGRLAGATIGAAVPQNGIQYHGGPVVMGEKVTAIYWASAPIFAGGPDPVTTPTGTPAQDNSLVGYFLKNLGGTPYYNINSTYTNSAGTPIPNALTYTGFWANNTNVPSNCTPVVSDSAIQQMIISGFTSGKLTYDPSTVYAVFSAGTVNLGGGFGSCSGAGTSFQYCAYHGAFTYNNQAVLYAAMPYNAAYTGTGCTSFAAGGAPNSDPGADAEVNVLAHELEEANTDPQLNAWWTTADGSENADKCAWTFGTVNLNNNTANISVGATNYLVQQNWLNLNGGSCQKTYAPVAPSAPGAPTLNVPTAGNTQLTLTWSAAAANGSTVTNYNVYRGTSSGGELLLTTLGNVTTFTNTGLTNGTRYYYKVSAVNGIGEGAQSGEQSAIPSATGLPGAPTLSARTASLRGVQLTWNTPSNGGSTITGYRVYRSTSTGTEVLLTTRSAGSTAWRDTGTTSGVTYFYRISATNGNGEGALSNEASARAR